MSLGKALEFYQSGRWQEAERLCRVMVETNPDDHQACDLLGIILMETGSSVEAETFLKRAVEATGAAGIYWLHYATLLSQSSERESECEEAFRAAIEMEPKSAYAQASFGLYLAQRGRFEFALDPLRLSVELAPDEASYWLNFGNVLRKLGRIDEAVAVFERALELDKENAGVENCLGDAWQAKGDLLKAVHHFEAATVKNASYAQGFGNLGIALSRLGRMKDAENAFDEAIRLQPNFANFHAGKGAMLRDACQIHQALESFRRALELEPRNADIASKYLYTLNFSPSLSPEEVDLEHGRLSGLFGADEPVLRRKLGDNLDRPIRIGFLSGDFSSHSVAFFLLPLYEAIDRSRFRICSFSETEGEDGVTSTFRELSDAWVDTKGRSASDVVHAIDRESVDVLIDLAGHTEGSRLDVLAAARVPLKFTWLGYPHRLCFADLDGRIVDTVTDAPGRELASSGERLVRMEGCFLCYRAGENAVAVTDLPASKKGFLTFGSFNNAAKVNEEVVGLWAEVLRAVPGSRLLLKSWQYADLSLVDRVSDWFAARGIERDRLEFRGRAERYADHMGMYGEVDIALDTFPYNGTTTTCEALRMGVPTLVLEGDRHAARVGASLLRHAGMGEWVAGNLTEFVAKAVAFAGAPEALKATRMSLRDRLASSPLGDAAGFARRFENVLLGGLKELEKETDMRGWVDRIEIAGEVTDGILGYEEALGKLPADLKGTRVLDASCIDGFWAVQAMVRGASEVVCLPAEGAFAFDDAGELTLARSDYFDWCRARLGAEAEQMQLLSGQLYNATPDVVGVFDWVILTANANQLRHLTFALDALRSVCRGKLLLSLSVAADEAEGRAAILVGEGEDLWRPTLSGVESLLKVSNFSVFERTVEEGPAGVNRAVFVAEPVG